MSVEYAVFVGINLIGFAFGIANVLNRPSAGRFVLLSMSALFTGFAIGRLL